LEEDRVKSAFEIAMERISALPELTAEEIAEQKEKEFKPVGPAISHKYFEGQITEDELVSELSRYQGEKGEIVRRAAVSSLCRAIQLEDRARADKALAGLNVLAAPEAGFREPLLEKFLQISSDFDRELLIENKRLESLIRADLEGAGIRGSAVTPNLVQNRTWLQAVDRLLQSYEPRLEEIRNDLMNRLAKKPCN
jgi:hypothetical protein